MTTKEKINQQLEQLSEEQLDQVSEFIAFLKFREKFINPIINTERISQLYQEFAEEDRQLAEQGINEYAELLKQEDQSWKLNEETFILVILAQYKDQNKVVFVQSSSFKKIPFLNLRQLSSLFL